MSERQRTDDEKNMRHPMLANPEGLGLVVVDVQEKFAPIIPGFGDIVKSIVALVKGFQEFNLPVIVTEQYPKGLGKTVAPISDCFTALNPVEKTTFSTMQDKGFTNRLKETGADALIVCGIETHICVYQTVCDMLHKGYRVWIPWDAVGSREPENRSLAIGRMEKAGAFPTSVEMFLFEMAVRAGTDIFRKIQALIK